MEYQMIDSVLAKKSLATDPAFDDLVISIKPIPSFNGCPLGLYYPDTGTIVLPPDALEPALLHELGHRHGHYYYGDLSEGYAEDFRKIYQPKGRALLYAGNHFENLSKFGVLFEEGEKGAVEVALLQPLTYNELYDIKSQLRAYYAEYQCECIECGYVARSEEHCLSLVCPRCGGEMRRAERPGPGIPMLYYGGGNNPFIRFEFAKSADWLVIIGAALAGTVVAGVGAIGYAIYKTAETTPWVVPVALAGVGALLLLRAAAREVVR